MTTKTDIKLPPLPVWMSRYVVPADDFEGGRDRLLDDLMEEYARAAVVADRKTRWVKERAQLEAEWSGLQQMKGAYEANRQGRMPSDEKLPDLFREALSWGRAWGRTISPQDWDECRDDRVAQLLFRYGSSQPAASAEPRPDEYDYFVDWYDNDAPSENEARPGDMARYAWLAGVRFADRFPVAARAAKEKA